MLSASGLARLAKISVGGILILPYEVSSPFARVKWTILRICFGRARTLMNCIVFFLRLFAISINCHEARIVFIVSKATRKLFKEQNLK